MRKGKFRLGYSKLYKGWILLDPAIDFPQIFPTWQQAMNAFYERVYWERIILDIN